MVKKGDTLIEVMLAVGIFSMIAISVAAVMSNGTSGAQNALESTIAREEIDTQAEALRFIQSAYIADKNSNNERFSKLWKKITEEKAITITPTNQYEDVLNFAPLDCRSLYEGDNAEVKNHAFIINPRMLSSPDQNIDKALVEFNDDPNNNQLQPASTYPRLIFGASDTDNSEQGGLVEEYQNNNELFRAEGIYVIAVKDAKTTNIVGEDSKTSAFYDFYIRTCWYGDNSDEPSTISTLIRLYDPDALPSLPSEPEDPGPVTPPSPVDPPKTTIADIEYMQDVTDEILRNTPDRMQKNLVDKRNGLLYPVRKYSNVLWQLSPLRNLANLDLTEEDSAIYQSTWRINRVSLNSHISTYRQPLGDYYKYNFCAILGGFPGACDLSSQSSVINKRYSICPRDWSLPSVEDFNKAKGAGISNGMYWTSTDSGRPDKAIGYNTQYSLSVIPAKSSYRSIVCIYEAH